MPSCANPAAHVAISAKTRERCLCMAHNLPGNITIGGAIGQFPKWLSPRGQAIGGLPSPSVYELIHFPGAVELEQNHRIIILGESTFSQPHDGQRIRKAGMVDLDADFQF